MVLHILRGDPALRDFEHIQVDSPGMAYLFFYDKQGHSGLKQDATETLRAHVTEAFLEWISHCAHFVIIVLLQGDEPCRTEVSFQQTRVFGFEMGCH